jgi:uncharacterized membrane protein YfbV (UPF0208 family)
MTGRIGRPGMNAVLAAAIAVSLPIGGSVALAANAVGHAAGRAAGPAARHGARHGAEAAAWRAVTLAPGASLAAGQVGPRSAVPWRRVGAGWVLAEYWPGQFGFQGKPKAAVATLYLIDPAGGRYWLHRSAVTKNPPFLVDWSGDKSRALLSGTGWLEQVTLATGQVRRFSIDPAVQVIGYTRPDGRGLLGRRPVGSRFQLARYTLTGQLAKILAVGAHDYTAVYSPSGRTLAVGGSNGVQLVSNNGGVLRTLPVAGTGSAGCSPSRWWSAGTILASCQVRGTHRDRLWLVPADGGKPVRLTSRRGHGRDPIDIDAWRLASGLYLQAIGSSGTIRIVKNETDGQTRLVSVPRTSGNNWILAARGSRLLLSAQAPCDSSTSLLWFDPSNSHELMLLKTPRGLAGVLGSVPYGQPVANVTLLVSCGGLHP